MNRRKILIGMGALFSGATATLGTGAFSAVEADRQVTIDVAEDADAYLGLDPNHEDYSNSAYATGEDGIVKIDLTKGTETSKGVFADGVSPQAVTRIEEVLPVRNQGTQEVQVSITSKDFPIKKFDIFGTEIPNQNDTSLTEEPFPNLEAGDSLALGLEIDATGDIEELEDQIESLEVTVNASAEDVSDQ